MIRHELSPETKRRLDALFAEPDRGEAEAVLVEQCGNNLPLLDDVDEHGLERVRFAALKISNGRLSALREAVDLAKVDWRDLLMTAGFGHDANAHAS